MRSRIVLTLTLGILAAALIAPPTHATEEVRTSRPCTTTKGIALDVAAAAKMLLPPTRGKKPRPVGQARAQALADSLVSGADPCTDPPSEYAMTVAADIQALLDEGDLEAARELIRYYVESLLPYEPDPEPVDPEPGISTRAVGRAAVCEGFEKHELTPPDEIGVALELGRLAQLVGDEDIAAMAVTEAQSRTQKWVQSGAEGQATSIGDWLGLARMAMILGLDDDVTAPLVDKARGVAEQAYQAYNVIPCRTTPQKLDCFFKSAMTLSLIGSDKITESRISDDVESAIETVKKVKQGKKPRCGIEKYAFRMKFENTTENGETLSFDTGRVVFTVKDGKITSSDTGPLILSSVKNLGCWADYGDGWFKEGSANVTGGRFPYAVSGTDDGETLTLILAHSGMWKVTSNGGTGGGGIMGCDLLVKMAEVFLNIFPELLNQGIPLPAGAADYEEADSGFELHRPTGQQLPWSSFFEFRMLEPKR